MADIRKTEDPSTRVQLSFLEQNTMSQSQISLSPEAKKAFCNSMEAMLTKAVDDFNYSLTLEGSEISMNRKRKLADDFQDSAHWINTDRDFLREIAANAYGETGFQGLRYQLNAPSAVMTEIESIPGGIRHIECKLQELINRFIKTVQIRYTIVFILDREGLKKHVNSVLGAVV